MSNIEKRSFSLPTEHAAFIDALVTSGAYASGSEVVRAGLRALQERDAAVERWLRNEVAPTYDAMKENPSRGIPAEDVFAMVRAKHAKRGVRTKTWTTKEVVHVFLRRQTSSG